MLYNIKLAVSHQPMNKPPALQQRSLCAVIVTRQKLNPAKLQASKLHAVRSSMDEVKIAFHCDTSTSIAPSSCALETVSASACACVGLTLVLGIAIGEAALAFDTALM